MCVILLLLIATRKQNDTFTRQIKMFTLLASHWFVILLAKRDSTPVLNDVVYCV